MSFGYETVHWGNQGRERAQTRVLTTTTTTNLSNSVVSDRFLDWLGDYWFSLALYHISYIWEWKKMENAWDNN
jgi:hypothetical protein